ncbi:hypothetical protein [Variovorax sp. RO1]|uniref:hypothetical protein n=1 Tax=Variovorax sp. RO1 TaxID=2066034 RepID=UPI00117F8176|nr:hypothetical protein [Variovorax sp. RO1]
MTYINYLCIDDQPTEVAGKLELLGRASDRLRLGCVAPTKSIDDIVKQIEARRDISGLLVDLRLDRVAGLEGRVQYNAPTIAQHIRSLMAQKKLPALPIVLWTLPARKKSLYDPDRPSHDLFDEVIDKDELEGDAQFTAAAIALVDLALGYQQLSANLTRAKKLSSLLEAPKTAIDPRADAAFAAEQMDGRSVSDAARFILSDVVRREGLLVSVDTLCARLGVSVEAFIGSKLENALTPFQYEGPFSKRRPMWWWKAVQAWWAIKFKEYPAVLSLEAALRVQLLHGKELISAEAEAKRIKDAYSSRFTGVCDVLRKPLDPIDGYLLDASQARPWSDRQYVSQEVAHAPARFSFDKNRLDPLVRARLRFN